MTAALLPATSRECALVLPRESSSHPTTVRAAFTLVEVLVATAITLMLMAILVTMFANIGQTVSGSRATLEMTDRQRACQHRLQADLNGITAQTLPPLRPEKGPGYTEIVEGPVGPVTLPQSVSSLDENEAFVAFDTTLGDNDDCIMFTTRSQGETFVGRFSFLPFVNGHPQVEGLESPLAEVAWFLRGTTLYRRVLLIRTNRLPDYDRTTAAFDDIPPTTGLYAGYDLSMRQEGGGYDRSPAPGPVRVSLNSLGDLTRRECRYGHQPLTWPHQSAVFWDRLGLPTLRECSDGGWPFPIFDPTPGGSTITAANLVVPNINLPVTTVTGVEEFSPWGNPFPFAEVDPATGTALNYLNGPRIADDVILTNVLSFDIKVWDPLAPIVADSVTGTVWQPEDPGYVVALGLVGTNPTYTVLTAGAFVDLGYYPGAAGSPPISPFAQQGNIASGLATAAGTAARTYDTWSFHYEQDGLNQDGDAFIDEGTDGLDNDGVNGVDDSGELECPPPYAVALRGIQIRIRCFEPDSRTVRELVVVKEFLPE